MGILAVKADERIKDVKFTDDSLCVDPMDGRAIAVPLAWYPRLAGAMAAQLAHREIAGAGRGIRWPDLDEDLGSEGLLRGAPAPSATGTQLRGCPSGGSDRHAPGSADMLRL